MRITFTALCCENGGAVDGTQCIDVAADDRAKSIIITVRDSRLQGTTSRTVAHELGDCPGRQVDRNP